jgi:hypothetical protein
MSGFAQLSLAHESREPPRVCRRLLPLSRMEHHEQNNEQVSPEVRERAVRMVLSNESQHESR